jgi:septal ring factor EnvC (AmiA/AmiB activator)
LFDGEKEAEEEEELAERTVSSSLSSLSSERKEPTASSTSTISDSSNVSPSLDLPALELRWPLDGRVLTSLAKPTPPCSAR